MNDASQPTDAPEPPSSEGFAGRSTAIFLSGVIGVAAVGYFVGINDGVPREDYAPMVTSNTEAAESDSSSADTALIPAVTYAEMRRGSSGPTSGWNPTLETVVQPKFDLFAEIKPSEADKRKSTLIRASRRAFNGAPPIIPHAIERTDDSACYACHGQGMRIGDRIANRMSHGFLANCTQCHSPPPPKPFASLDAEVENTFVGLPAPLKGERAFEGAPPTIPHSRWMRQECLACHGNKAGWAGLQATHPWRINCTQCHAPSATLDQAVVQAQIGFLPGPSVAEE